MSELLTKKGDLGTKLGRMKRTKRKIEEIRERMTEKLISSLEEHYQDQVLQELEDIMKQGEDIINEREHKLKV